jgi:hypothetical protein
MELLHLPHECGRHGRAGYSRPRTDSDHLTNDLRQVAAFAALLQMRAHFSFRVLSVNRVTIEFLCIGMEALGVRN